MDIGLIVLVKQESALDFCTFLEQSDRFYADEVSHNVYLFPEQIELQANLLTELVEALTKAGLIENVHIWQTVR
jgi:hypothetical protein